MELDIDFANWGYSETEREHIRAAVSDFIENARGYDLWRKLPTIAAWYAESPYPEDVDQLLESFLDRLYKECDLFPTEEDEVFGEDDSTGDKKRLDRLAVQSILHCVANEIPTGAIAMFADKVKDIANIANQYLELVVRNDVLYDHELRDIVEEFEGVAGFADYFTGGDRSIRSDAVETLLDWYFNQPFVLEAFAKSFVRGLEYDRRAGTLDQRLPWWRWFFDQMIGRDGEFWRSVFAVDPLPFAQGFLYMVWNTDAPFADWERAMWYHRLARLAESGVEWDADDVLRMGREPELVAKLLCGEVANTR